MVVVVVVTVACHAGAESACIPVLHVLQLLLSIQSKRKTVSSSKSPVRA